MNEIINRKTFHLETIRCTIGAAQQMINENKELQLLFEETTSNETIPTGKSKVLNFVLLILYFNQLIIL